MEIKAGRIVGRKINGQGKRDDYNPDILTAQRFEVNKNPQKTNCLTTVTKDNVIRISGIKCFNPNNSQHARVYSIDGKAPTSTSGGVSRGTKIGVSVDEYRILFPIEYERLQTLPEGYTSPISNTQRYKVIGNGWTVDVIAHIFKGLQNKEPMRVLSCFDGISCGQIALERVGIKVDKYFASEIDKHAIKVTQHNYPNTVQLGDVTTVNDLIVNNIDLLMGGSPCQGFSFAGKQLNFDDPRSKLFFEFVRLKEELKPTWFLLENVRMKKESQDVISKYLGVEPVVINSNLVSAQNRHRLYWTNIPFGDLPKDKGILLKDILESEYAFDLYQKTGKLKTNTAKSGCLTGTANAAGNHSQMDVVVKKGETIEYTNTGRINIHVNPFVRRYSLQECEKLQTIPTGYTMSLSNSQAYKSIINGWTVDVIAHIFKGLPV